MPGLGDPLVRRMRRMAAAYAAFPGTPASHPMDVLDRYERRGSTPLAVDADDPEQLTRREVLKRGAALGTAVVGASALGWGAARRANASDADVVIVGAGLAGLSCAYRLSRHGIPSHVYEARSRLGGRCWTVRVFDHHQTAEHGGQYIDSRHHQIRQLANELGVPLVDTFEQSFPAGENSPLWLDGALRDPDVVFADFGVFIDRLKKDYQRVGRYFYDKAGPEAIEFDQMTEVEWLDANLPGGSASLLGRAIERSNTGFWGLDGDQLSAINFFEFYIFPYPGADERYRVVGGNDRVVDALVDALPQSAIHRERPLEAIWHRGDGRIGMHFDGLSNDAVADVVVLALPFTVLRDVDTSGLDLTRRRRRAIRTLAMGTNAKLQLQLNRSFADLDWSASFRSDEPEFGTWDSTYGQSRPAPNTPVLTIYNGGRAGAGYPTDDPHGIASPGIVDTALDALARGVDDIHDAYGGIAYLDSWVDDPWVHGSYAGFYPGQYTDFWGFLEKREGNVLFAGEHTSTHSQGYLNGGVESGERAARQVLNSLA